MHYFCIRNVPMIDMLLSIGLLIVNIELIIKIYCRIERCNAAIAKNAVFSGPSDRAQTCNCLSIDLHCNISVNCDSHNSSTAHWLPKNCSLALDWPPKFNYLPWWPPSFITFSPRKLTTLPRSKFAYKKNHKYTGSHFLLPQSPPSLSSQVCDLTVYCTKLCSLYMYPSTIPAAP